MCDSEMMRQKGKAAFSLIQSGMKIGGGLGSSNTVYLWERGGEAF